jgi:hypothetical protein
VRAVAALLALSALAPVARADDPPSPEVTASLAALHSDRLDLAGWLRARAPLVQVGGFSVVLDVEAVTAIERTAADFTFLVDEVDYRLGFGARHPLGSAGAVDFGLSERGAVRVDEPGRARLRMATIAWESPGYRHAFGPSGWNGRVEVGGVLGRSGIDAYATARAQVRWLRRAGRVRFGADADVDALIGRDRGTDVLIGPRVEFPLGDDRRIGLYARWLHGGHPLGLKTDGVLLGFDFAQGIDARASRPTPPEVSGLVAGGGGDGGRATARLLVRVASPPFSGGTNIEAEVDANLLTAHDGNDLFYLYDVGASHPIGSWRVGGWFYHRSNHRLEGFNPTVTSLNVLEAGVETEGYGRGDPGVPLGRLGRAGGIDLRVRAGWLISNGFGEDARWHARAAARWTSPEIARDLRALVESAWEGGARGGTSYAAGLLLPRGWQVRVELRHDEQLYSDDRRALLGTATLYF